MKSKGEPLTSPPTKPWLLDNTSSSSLKKMEVGVRPSLATVATYRTKPLPPLPPITIRRSGVSSFSREVQNAFRTPDGSVKSYSSEVRDLREASIAVILDAQSPVMGETPQLDINNNFTERPIPNIHPLLPTGSVQKLLQITGAGSAASLATSTTSLTPSGHNPALKIKQIMGIDVGHDGSESQGSRDPGHEISPLSPGADSSSIYSEDRADTVSEPDADTYDGPKQVWAAKQAIATNSHLGAPRPWRDPSFATSAVPIPLRIVKERERVAFGQTPNPRDEPESPLDSYNQGNLYHTTVAEIAQSASSSSAYSQSEGGDCHEANKFPHLRQPYQRQGSFSTRTYQSNVRIAPPVELAKLDTLSSKIYHAPVKTPYPLPPSRFDDDDDDDDDVTPTQRNYDTDSAISPRATKRPSLMFRVFRRNSNSSSAIFGSLRLPGPTPAPPSVSVPENTRISGFDASAIPDPLFLKPRPPPPLRERQLRERQYRSHDSLRSHTPTVFSTTPSTNYTAGTSRSETPVPAPLVPPPQNQYVSLTHPTIPPRGPVIPPREPPRPARGPSPGVPLRGRPEPAPPRAASTRYHQQHASKPSLAEAAAKNIGIWAARTGELVGQAKAAAAKAMKGLEEKRRHEDLKSRIRVVMPGRRFGGAAPVPGKGKAASVAKSTAKPVLVLYPEGATVAQADKRAWF